MTVDGVIDRILADEGGFSNDPLDKGGATNFGITAADLGRYRGYGRPATVAEVKAMPIEEARAIYTSRYVPPFASVTNEDLRAQLVDFGVLEGTVTAVRTLQQVLGVPVDGVLGDRTRTALNALAPRLVNNALVGARVRLLAGIVAHDASQARFLHGWVNRAVSYFVV